MVEENAPTPKDVSTPKDVPKSPSTSGKLKEYLKTTRGKVMAIAFIVVLLVFIGGMTVLFVILLRQVPSQPQVSKPKPATTQETKQAPTEEPTSKEAPTTQPSPVPPVPETFEVYEYKDPFQPLVGAAPEATATATTTTETTPAGTTTATTSTNGTVTTTSLPLILLDVSTQGGIRYASVKYGSTVYKLKEGEIVGRSSYQVVSIGTNSVTLIYGDDRVVLEIGEQVIR